MAAIGDVNSDGVPDLAVGTKNRGADDGALFILFLLRDGGVSSYTELDRGNVPNPWPAGGTCGDGVSGVGSATGGGLDAAAGPDVAVGCWNVSSGTGAVWLLFLSTSGGAVSSASIASTSLGVSDVLAAGRMGLGLSTFPQDLKSRRFP